MTTKKLCYRSASFLVIETKIYPENCYCLVEFEMLLI